MLCSIKKKIQNTKYLCRILDSKKKKNSSNYCITLLFLAYKCSSNIVVKKTGMHITYCDRVFFLSCIEQITKSKYCRKIRILQ